MGEKIKTLSKGKILSKEFEIDLNHLPRTGLDYEVEVLKFYFKGNKHIYNNYNSNSKKLLIWFLKKIYRKLKRAVKH